MEIVLLKPDDPLFQLASAFGGMMISKHRLVFRTDVSLDTVRIPHHLADLLLELCSSESLLALARHDVNHRLVFLKLPRQPEVNCALTRQPERRLVSLVPVGLMWACMVVPLLSPLARAHASREP